MPKIFKKKNVIPLTYIVLIIFISVFFLSISPPELIEVYNQSKNDISVGEIYGSKKIGQTFNADHKILSAIEVLLATFNRVNEGSIVFHLRDSLKSEDNMVWYNVNMSEIQDNTFFRFSIPKIRNYKGEKVLFSKKKKYYFYLESPKAEPGNAISIWSSSKNLYKNGEKIINGVSSQGDLVFKTEYELGWRLSFHTLSKRLMNILHFIPNIIKNQVIYYVLLLMLFIWILITIVTKFEIFQRKGGLFFVFGFVVFIISICIVLLFLKKIEVYNQFAPNHVAGEIYGGKRVGQTFTAQHDHLMAIEVLVGTYNRKNAGELIFHMKGQAGDVIDLHHSRVDMINIKDNRYFRFKVPEIKNSKGRKYFFYLEAPNAQPGNAITIWCNDKEDKYREGAKIINGEEIEGDLVFKTIYAVGLGGKIGLFLGEITRNKPSPLNKKLFYVVLIILFILTCSLFLTYILRAFVETLYHNSKHSQ